MSKEVAEKSKRWRPLFIMGLVVFAALVVSIVSFAFKNKDISSFSDLSIRENRLTELEYKQAIAEYQIQLELDPKNEQIKNQLTQTYVDWALLAADEDDYSMAREILRVGFSETKSPDLVWEIAKISLKGMGLEDMLEQAVDGFGLFG